MDMTDRKCPECGELCGTGTYRAADGATYCGLACLHKSAGGILRGATIENAPVGIELNFDALLAAREEKSDG